MTDRETLLVLFFQSLKVLRARRLINLNIHLAKARASVQHPSSAPSFGTVGGDLDNHAGRVPAQQEAA